MGAYISEPTVMTNRYQRVIVVQAVLRNVNCAGFSADYYMKDAVCVKTLEMTGRIWYI